MSASLAFRPVIPEKNMYLCDWLKFRLRDKYELHDGSSILTSDDIPYLNGLMDATDNKDAKKGLAKLISTIDKYNQVLLLLEY